MVEEQIAHPRDGRDAVTDGRVVEAMRAVPRHDFVPERLRPDAYDDPAAHRPRADHLAALHRRLHDRAARAEAGRPVLEIGTGSGYQAAVLAELVAQVYTIEIVDELAQRAAADLKRLGYTNVHVRAGDGYQGWAEAAPFDAIIVTCAPERVPQPLIDQLKDGGRIIIPVGRAWTAPNSSLS